MDVEQHKRVIQGIVSINLSIFLASSVFFTEQGSFSWDTGNLYRLFFQYAISKEQVGIAAL
jgi:hypothetical protein